MNVLKFNYKIILFFIGIAFVFPFIVLGHGLGASYEETVDGYKIDIGYEPETVTSESRVRFNFSISNEESNDEVMYSDVWVRINEGSQTVFASGIHHPEFDGAGLLYTFPKEGNYEISTRFQNGSESLAEVTFPLEVQSAGEDTATSTPSLLAVGLIGLVFGGLLSFIFMRKKNV
ncbi:hypothetical protein HQ403_00460 [Candidatus Kaiserbacteria bacterium]|nr:hypothetical protein [Candidatus Kaiserbacteria bacterium]